MAARPEANFRPDLREAVGADVVVGEWSFTFWFPLRSVQVLEGGRSFIALQANGHDGFFAVVEFEAPVRVARPRERERAGLAARALNF